MGDPIFLSVDNVFKVHNPSALYFGIPLLQYSIIITSAPNLDKLVKRQTWPVFVIPANAGIQGSQSLLDSRVRGSDGLGDFLRTHQFSDDNFFFIESSRISQIHPLWINLLPQDAQFVFTRGI